MKLVIDANVLFSALIGGNISELMLSSEVELYAPNILIIEIRNNKEEIIRKSRFSQNEVEILLSIFERRIAQVLFSGFSARFHEAEILLGNHPKDVPYIALAMQLRCPLWTYEKRLREKTSTISTAQVRRLLGK